MEGGEGGREGGSGAGKDHQVASICPPLQLRCPNLSKVKHL